MKKSLVRRVSKQVGLNPVAQAVARNNLRQGVLDLKIYMLMLEQGAPCAGALGPVAAVLQVVHMGCAAEGINTPEVKVLEGALSAAVQQAQQDSYDKLQTVAIIAGLDRALTLIKVLRPGTINTAWHKLHTTGVDS